MRRRMRLLVLAILVPTLLSGCLVPYWWHDGYGHGGGHHGGRGHGGGHGGGGRH